MRNSTRLTGPNAPSVIKAIGIVAPVLPVLALAGTTWGTPEARLRLIAKTGDPAPGLPGLTFADVSSPRLNASGRIGFVGILAGSGVVDGNDSTLWTAPAVGTPPSLLLREAMPGPFTNAGQIDGVSLPQLNGAGEFVLPVSDFVSTSNPTVVGFIAVNPAGTVRAIAREGFAAPGFDPARNFDGLSVPAVNSSGKVAFASNRFVSSGILAGLPAFGGGVFTDRSGAVQLIAAPGQPAPGLTGIAFLALESPALNDSGALAFRATLSGTGLTEDTNTAIFTDRSGSLTLVAAAGQPAPGFPAGALFKELALQPVILPSGLIVFWGGTTAGGVTPANDAAIFTDDGASQRIMIREGDPVPSLPGVSFGTFSRNPSVASDGSIALGASLIGDGITASNNSCILLIGPATGASPSLLAREGALAPHLSSPAVFTSFGDPVLSESGRVVFSAQVRPAASAPFSREVIYSWSATDGLVPLVQEDDHVTIESDPPVTGTVRTIAFENLNLAGAGVSGDHTLLRIGFADFSAALVDATTRCPADYNGDGSIDADDLGDFITDYFSPTPSGRADFNADGSTNADDLADFITRYFSGCD